MAKNHNTLQQSIQREFNILQRTIGMTYTRPLKKSINEYNDLNIIIIVKQLVTQTMSVKTIDKSQLRRFREFRIYDSVDSREFSRSFALITIQSLNCRFDVIPRK